MARGNYSSFAPVFQPLPLHLCLFLLTVLLFLGFSWYIDYESTFENMMDQMKIGLLLCPLLLLLVVHWLSTEERQRVPLFIPLPERESFHRAGGSPWGVAAVLVLLLFMISYQSSFHERWFPLLSKR